MKKSEETDGRDEKSSQGRTGDSAELEDSRRSRLMLHSLLEIAKAVNSAPDRDRLFSYILTRAMKAIEATGMAIFLSHGEALQAAPSKGKKGGYADSLAQEGELSQASAQELRIHAMLGSFGAIDQNSVRAGTPGYINSLVSSSWQTGALFIHSPGIDESQQSWVRPVPAIPTEAGGILTVPLKSGEKILGVLYAENNSATCGFSDDQLSFTKGLCEIITSGLNAFLTREILVMKSRTEEELAIGARIQRDLLPRKAPEVKGFDIYGKNIPAKEIGGDYFDFFLLDQDHLVILVCDVSGKGVASGMVATMIRSIIRSHMDLCSNPMAMMEKLNSVLVNDVEDGMYATIFFSVLELSTRVLTYSCCGHEPPIISKPGNPLLRKLEARGMAVGLFDGALFSMASVKLKLGERLIIFTDGVTDLEDPRGEALEIDHFEEFIQEAVGSNPREFFNSTFQMLRAYQGSAEQADDITMVVVDVLLPFMKPTFVEE